MKSLQQILETDASVNMTAAVATPDAPLFMTRRFAGQDDHVIPEDHYLKLRNGRNRQSRWDQHLPEPTIQAAVRKSLYRDGACLITNAKSGLSVMLKHAIQRRAQKGQDIDATMMAESTDWEANGDFTLFDESSVMPLILEQGEQHDFEEDEDEFYLDAYNFYLDLGVSEDEADAFAQIVACFFDNLDSANDYSATIDSLFNAAVSEVKAGTEMLGLVPIDLKVIHAARAYIADNYDIVNGEVQEDGTIDYEVEVDDEPVAEAAVLAALPEVNPEDQSKDENEGWAIINLDGNKIIDKPKKGETMEHKQAWLKEYYGAAAAGEGHEVAWVNVKTGVVTKVKADGPKSSK